MDLRTSSELDSLLSATSPDLLENWHQFMKELQERGRSEEEENALLEVSLKGTYSI